MKVEDHEDTVKFQEDLNKVYEWPERNNMKFEGYKFQNLRYGKR